MSEISPLSQAYINSCNAKDQQTTQNQSKNYLNDNCLDSVELSQKQSGIKSFGKGILYSLGGFVPFLGQHIVGSMAYNQKEAAEIVKDLKDGDIDNEISKKGAGSKMAKGLISSVLCAIPFVGTYLTGKHKYERENLAQDINDIKDGKEVQTHDKKGVIKTYFKGLWESIKTIIPVYGTYYLGKEVAVMKNLNTDAKNIAKTLSPDSVEEKK